MKVRNLDLTNSPVNEEHRRLGLPPVEDVVTHPQRHPVVHGAMWAAAAILAGLTLILFSRLFVGNWANGWNSVGETLAGSMFWTAVAVGFFAQAVDGALGMAYGITATTFLLSTGATPALATASVHIAEIFTTGLSGIAHAKFGNVDKKLFVRLLVPGIIGSVLGALLVTQVDASIIKPIMAGYLLLMGLYVLNKARRHIQQRTRQLRHVGKLATLGGFVDAAGGGGWGPVVTTTLLSSGNDPRTTIGSVNFAEFFLTLASGATFTLLVGTSPWPIVAGLIIGGLFAAPFAALLCRTLRARVLLVLVGILISALSVYNLYRALA
jgi:uncharacterized protein